MKKLLSILIVSMFFLCILPIPFVYAASGSTMIINMSPQAPTDFRVFSTFPGKIKLTWTDNASNETGFILEKRMANTTEAWSLISKTVSDINSYNDTEFISGQEYEYRICAYNNFGKSAYKTTLFVKPAAPSELTVVSIGTTEVSLSWTDNSDSEEEFRLNIKYLGSPDLAPGGDEGKRVPANITECTITDLIPDYPFRITVYAYNRAYYSDPESVEVRTKPLLEDPVAPSNLTVVNVGSTEVTLSWTDNSDNEEGFTIFRNLVDGSGDQLLSAEADSTEYTARGLRPSSLYQFSVFSRNEAGESTYSNIVEVTTKPLEEEVPLVEPEEDIPPVDPLPASSEDNCQISLYLDNQDYSVDGITKHMDVTPVILKSRTFLPIKYVVEPLGAVVGWDGVERKVTIELDGKVIELWIDKNSALVNGSYKLIDSTNPNVSPCILPPGRTMLPVRFVTEQLGCNVEWNGDLRRVNVTYTSP